MVNFADPECGCDHQGSRHATESAQTGAHTNGTSLNGRVRRAAVTRPGIEDMKQGHGALLTSR